MNSRTTLSALAATILLSGCGLSTSRSGHGPEPAACADSVYVQLGRQHPDSLSERAWQRLQNLDSACVRAREQMAGEMQPSGMMGTGMMDMGHGQGRAWTILAPLLLLSMAAMMVILRF